MANSETETEKLAALISEWREPGALVRVPPAFVVPDSTNREHTQLSVEHIHYIASLMEKGFKSRRPGSTEGHDIPVLVRGHPRCPMALAALTAWQKRAADHAGFSKPDADLLTGGQWFCSLGNSHFFGALNLFRTGWSSIFTKRRYAISASDPALRAAVESGVESVVLRAETPRAARKEISLLLNKCHDAKWAISETGEVILYAGKDEYSQFEALSKARSESLSSPNRLENAIREKAVCDADELGALLRIKLGINESDADGGYKDTLFASSTGTEQPVPATGAEKGAVDEVSFSVQAGGGAGPAEPGEAGIEEAAAAVAGEHSAIITRAPTASVAAEDEEDGEEKGEAEARRGRRGLLPRASAGVPAGGGAAATTAAGARLLSSSSARRHSIPPQLEETGGRSRAFVLHRSKL